MIAGLEKTGGVITSAGLILAGTFAALMALELEALFQVGFTVALGLLVDAFLVRTFLVPSIALLLGERNWWPSFWLARKAKDVALSPPVAVDFRAHIRSGGGLRWDAGGDTCRGSRAPRWRHGRCPALASGQQADVPASS